MTIEQIENLKIPIANLNDETCLMIESGIEWINSNTTLHIDVNESIELTPNVKLFIVKFVEIMSIRPGVSSESISGLSQSFSIEDQRALIRQYANTLLGEYMKSDMTFVSAKRRWDAREC